MSSLQVREAETQEYRRRMEDAQEAMEESSRAEAIAQGKLQDALDDAQRERDRSAAMEAEVARVNDLTEVGEEVTNRQNSQALARAQLPPRRLSHIPAPACSRDGVVVVPMSSVYRSWFCTGAASRARCTAWRNE